MTGNVPDVFKWVRKKLATKEQMTVETNKSRTLITVENLLLYLLLYLLKLSEDPVKRNCLKRFAVILNYSTRILIRYQ
jgi:hypothetical protein